MKFLNRIGQNLNTELSEESPMMDAELWELFKKGDEAAFKRIYFRNYPMLHQYARNICKDEHVSDDVIQDMFSDLWHSRRNLGVAVSIKAYLFSSLRRRILLKMKQIRRKQVLALELFTFNPDIEFSPEMVLIREEGNYFRRSIVKEALNQLSKRQKEVIYLRFYQDIPYKEVAKIMGINYQSVLNYCQKALQILRTNDALLRVVSEDAIR
ncbi:RNA polymerase sigma factor, sigma-70 family [Parapedobacter composti]|uniref:RNA polymerase sigma factor, sigma-70 family n=1 Tax=Parapedobacter composti TaxID=623281 RepID=A0A1I1DT03_9SPHI|nr:sigma-70 family RNA polymerase sigma factor [Parapedobacter composti]SFB78031.1 RNA polymerase sigma factor, sigma-70 family [Parapedobacter composti]